MKTGILSKMKSSTFIFKAKISKRSPEILLGIGIVGFVAGAVSACVATVKAQKVVEEAKESFDDIRKCTENAVLVEKYTPEQKRKDTFIVIAKVGRKLFALYAPALAFIGLGTVGVCGSHKKLKSRNAELFATNAALAAAFGEYRNRTKKLIGEEAERNLYYGLRNEEHVTIEVNPETGERKETRDILSVVEDCPLSPYAVYFDRSSPQWEESLNGNGMWLRAVQQHFNDLLRGRDERLHYGVFLNEVYSYIGVPVTKAGQHVGWIYDKNAGDRDNYIDFGIQQVKRPDGKGGYYDAFLLDFNVDGDILAKM